MILKSETEKASGVYAKSIIPHPSHRAILYLTTKDKYDEIFDSFKKGFEFREWLQQWYHVGNGWIKEISAFEQHVYSMKELVELFLKEKS